MEQKEYNFKVTLVAEKYYNNDSCWGCFVVRTNDDVPHLKDDIDLEFKPIKTISIIGKMPKLRKGEVYDICGEPQYSSKYQTYSYEVKSIISTLPTSQSQQEQFLLSIISETQAKELLRHYPDIVQQVVDNHSLEIDTTKTHGIKEATWVKIRGKIILNYGIIEILNMFKDTDVTMSVISRMLKFEPNTLLLKQKLEKDPYLLTQVNGFGFHRADKAALKLNPDLRISIQRTLACIKYFFSELANSNGDTYSDYETLSEFINNQVPECFNKFLDFYEKELLENRFLKTEDGNVAMRFYYEQEMGMYARINLLNKAETHIKVSEEDIVKGIEITEQQQGFSFDETQKKYIKNCCLSKNNVFFISGLAGTGKTTVLRAILNIFKFNYTVGCCALSAKASQRITEATGFPSSTIHRMLKFKNGIFEKNETDTLYPEIIVLDEASMVDCWLFNALLKAIKHGSKFIVVGDDAQLSAIGYGNPFVDLLTYTSNFEVVKLTKIHRQAEDSGIITDSIKIRHGEYPLQKLELKTVTGKLQDMTYMFRDNRSKMQQMAVEIYLKCLMNSTPDDTIIIVPRKSNCENSTLELNKIIQEKLIPVGKSLKYGDQIFKVGAKVMQKVNNYDENVFNGETGYVTRIFKTSDNMDCLEVDFGNDKLIEYSSIALSDIQLSYVLTVHVSQGSGYDNVICVIDNTHYTLLNNCLLYTGLTRAKKKCLLIAEPKAYDKCIRTDGKQRNTWLRYYKLANKKRR